jgi:hypothetical protein
MTFLLSQKNDRCQWKGRLTMEKASAALNNALSLGKGPLPTTTLSFLSSRAQPTCPGVPWRDLQFRGPFLEMFSEPQNRMRLIRLLQSLNLRLIEMDSERVDRLIQVLHLAGADDR